MSPDTNTSNYPHTDNNLAGGYILLPAYDEDDKSGSDEVRIIYFAIDKEALKAFLGTDEVGVEHWLSEFTYDDSTEILQYGLLADNVAFVYNPDADDKLNMVRIQDNNALSAFIDFISGKLQENGMTDASKYLDCMFDL